MADLVLPYAASVATDINAFSVTNTLGEGQSDNDTSAVASVVGHGGICHGVHGDNGDGSGTTPQYGAGVWGDSDNGFGVYGASGDNVGVYGLSAGSDGIQGVSGSPEHAGISGTNSNGGTGVHGTAGDGSGHPAPTPTAGVWGDCDTGNGVYGASASWNGVEGDSWSPAHAGVAGQNNAGGPGVWGYSTGNAGQFEGNVAVSGTITVGGDVVLQNADCAEDFDVTDRDLAAGTVVVMSEDGTVRACDSEYATTVVGIISGAGDLRPGITLDRRPSPTPRMAVALMGKVYCMVDATCSPISMGDLLTTSKTEGHAMRVSDPGRAFGSVIGKALGGLAQGRGMIRVLVALQ